MNSQEFANRFFDDAAPPNGPEGWWSERCPTGKHENPTRGEFEWRDGDKAVVMKCFKGCTRDEILTALGLTKVDLRLDSLTLADLARMKGFTPEYLAGLGVEDLGGYIRIAYKNRDGSPTARNQFRGKRAERRFWWQDGNAPIVPYGLWRLDEAREQERLFLVEGASDCWAGWLHGLPMLGLPGATQANLLKADDLKDIPSLYIVKEPDAAGAEFIEGIRQRLRTIGYTGLATAIDLGEIKDVCDLHQKFSTVEPLMMGPYGQEPDGLGQFNDAIYNAISRGAALDLTEVVAAAEARAEQRTKTVMLTGKDFEDLQLLWDELLAANEPPTIFRYGGSLFKMREGGSLVALDTDRLLKRLITIVDWYKVTSNGPAPAKLDARLLRLILSDDERLVPRLDRVVRAPVFSTEGRLVQSPGYDAETGIYLTATDGLEVPPVSAVPTDAEVTRAVDLLSEMIVDFPFQSPADRATIFALLLLPFARNLVRGATPLHLIEAARPGTGKSLLLEVLSLVVLGKPVGAMTEADNEEETRKRITAQLLLEPSFVVFENLNRMMRGGAVAQALTCDTWEDRLLGQNKIVSIPVRCAWIAVANNPSFSEEVADRIVTCRIVADVERPRDRDPKQFKYPNLPQWVRENRGDLVWAALTIIQNWLAKGQPKGPVILGSFQTWAETMSGILEAAGVSGLLANRARLLESADPIGDARRAFVSYWYQEHGTETVYAADLIPAAGLADFANIDPDKKSKDNQRAAKSEQTKMGKALTGMVEVVFDLKDEDPPVRVTVSRGTPKQDKGGSRWRLVVKGPLMTPMAPDGTYGTSSEAQEPKEDGIPGDQGLSTSPAETKPRRAAEQVPPVPQGATGAIESRPSEDKDEYLQPARSAFCPHGREASTCILCRVPVRPSKKASKS